MSFEIQAQRTPINLDMIMKRILIALAAIALFFGTVGCEKPDDADMDNENSATETGATEEGAAGDMDHNADQAAEDDAPGTQPSSANDAPAGDEMTAEKAMEELPDVTPAELEEMMKSDTTVKVFDANGEATRTEIGTVPNAVLLASTENYEESVLPTDKSTKLVFYCGGPSCMAAPRAAARAVNLGHEDVAVMRAGINGWKEANLVVAAYEPAAE